MSVPATPAHPESLFYLVEDVCRRWEYILDHSADSGVAEWPLATFLDRIFHGWTVQAHLRLGNRSGIVLRNPEGLLYALPMYWPERFLTGAEDAADTLHDEDVEWDEEMSHRAYGRGDREACFDAAVSDACIAYARMDLIELLLGDNEVAGFDNFTGETVTGNPSGSALLAIEALIISADDTERDSLRMLTALRGVTPLTGYTRLA